MSPERVDKGLYEIQWIAHTEIQHDQAETATSPDSLSWLVFLDSDGVGTTLADQLRRRGHRVRAVLHQPVTALTKVDGGYALNPRQPEQLTPVDSKLTSKTKATSPASSTAGRWTSRRSDDRHADSRRNE